MRRVSASETNRCWAPSCRSRSSRRRSRRPNEDALAGPVAPLVVVRAPAPTDSGRARHGVVSSWRAFTIARGETGEEREQEPLHDPRRGGQDHGLAVALSERRPLDQRAQTPRRAGRCELLGPSQRGSCIEVERTTTNELARNRDEQKPANPARAGEPPELLIAARERIEVRPLAAPGNDRVSRRHHRVHTLANGAQRNRIAKIPAHDRGARGGDNGGIGARPHKRGDVLAAVNETPYEPKANLARSADDEDHAKRRPYCPTHALAGAHHRGRRAVRRPLSGGLAPARLELHDPPDPVRRPWQLLHTGRLLGSVQNLRVRVTRSGPELCLPTRSAASAKAQGEGRQGGRARRPRWLSPRGGLQPRLQAGGRDHAGRG